MPKKKETKDTRNWCEIQRDACFRDFDNAARDFIWQYQEGGGIRNIHMGDTLRTLQWKYTQGAAMVSAVQALENTLGSK